MHQHEESESLYGYVGELRGLPLMLDELGGVFSELAKQAEIDQPANPSLRDEILAVAAVVAQVAGNSQTWHPMARQMQERDMHRVENPTGGSVRLEGKNDAGMTFDE